MRFYLFTILILLNICAKSQHAFKLDIAVPKSFNGRSFTITILGNDKRKALIKDSTIVKNGILIYRGTIKERANFIAIETKKNKSKLSTIFIIDSGENNFKILTPDFTEGKSQVMKIEGNKASSVLDSLQDIVIDYNKKFAKMHGAMTSFGVKDMLTINTSQMQFLRKYPNDYFSLMMLFELSLYNHKVDYYTKVSETLDSFADTIKNSPLGKNLSNEIAKVFLANKSTVLGHQVPSFKIKRSDGTTFDNSILKGQVYIIVFSATWCGPCQEELPHLKSLYDKFKNTGLQIVYINLDDNIKTWLNHIKTNKLANWINVSEGKKANQTEISKQFAVYAVPTYFLINDKGQIVYNSVIDNNDKIGQLQSALLKINQHIK